MVINNNVSVIISFLIILLNHISTNIIVEVLNFFLSDNDVLYIFIVYDRTFIRKNDNSLTFKSYSFYNFINMSVYVC